MLAANFTSCVFIYILIEINATVFVYKQQIVT